MKIRKAVQEDAPYIAKVHVDSWRTTYKDILPENFLDGLSYDQRARLWETNMTEHSVFVAENNNGEIIGFSTGGKDREGKYDGYDGELYAIYMFAEYQGKGIGKALVEPVIKELVQNGINSMLVWVLEDNDSKYFYETIGGKKVETVDIKMAGVTLKETVYGWQNLNNFLKER